jgi:hypothetical protein
MPAGGGVHTRESSRVPVIQTFVLLGAVRERHVSQHIAHAPIYG